MEEVSFARCLDLGFKIICCFNNIDRISAQSSSSSIPSFAASLAASDKVTIRR